MLDAILITFAIAAAPGGGLRFSIPWALTFGNLSPEMTFAVSMVGEMAGVILLVYILDPIVHFARRHLPWLDRLIEHMLHHTRQKHSAGFERLGLLFLILAGASPIPGLGAHTGVIIAYLFGVKKSLTIFAITVGVTALAIAVLFATLGGIELWQLFAR